MNQVLRQLGSSGSAAHNSHAAPIRRRVESGREAGCLDASDDALDEREVHAAHHLSLLGGERVKWAVGERDDVVGLAWLEAMLTEGFHDGVGGYPLTGPTAGCHNGAAEILTRLTGNGVQHLSDGLPGLFCPGDGVGEDATSQVVAALRKADFEFGFAPAVHLCGPPSARTAAAFWSAVVGLDQTIGDETIQVELGDMVWDTNPRRRLLSADRLSLGDHEAIEGAAHRFSQTGQAVEAGVEISIHVFLPCQNLESFDKDSLLPVLEPSSELTG